MKTKLFAAAAVLFGYVLPALAAGTGAPKMIVVKTLLNDQGQAISSTATPIDFDKAVKDAVTAQEANAIAERTGVALALDTEEIAAADWGGRRFFNYGYYYSYPYYNYYTPYYYPYYNYSYYSYPYVYGYYYYPGYYGWRW